MVRAADFVARASAGDTDAFAKLYDTFSTQIYDFCRSILRNDADAGDAAQDTFVIAHQKLGTLRDPEKVGPWLYSIARRQSLRRIDQRKRFVPDVEVDDMNTGTDDAGRRLDEADAVTLVWDAACGLAPKDRLVLDLNLRHGLQGQDLADALEVNRQHAYVQVDKMKKALGRAAGALLVARYHRRDCEPLDAILADWDGTFDPLMRKRIARHIDGCETCERHRSALVAPDRLFSIVPMVAAPIALRAKVLATVRGEVTESGPSGTAGRRAAPSRPVLAVVIAAFAATIVVAAGFVPGLIGSSNDAPLRSTTTVGTSGDLVPDDTSPGTTDSTGAVSDTGVAGRGDGTTPAAPVLTAARRATTTVGTTPPIVVATSPPTVAAPTTIAATPTATSATTAAPTTAAPTSATTAVPTPTSATTAVPTATSATTAGPTTAAPTTAAPTSATTAVPTPTTAPPTSVVAGPGGGG